MILILASFWVFANGDGGVVKRGQAEVLTQEGGVLEIPGRMEILHSIDRQRYQILWTTKCLDL